MWGLFRDKSEAEAFNVFRFFTLRYFLLETSLMKGGRERRYSFIYLIPVNVLHGRIQGTKCGPRRSCLISPGEKAGMVLPAPPGKEHRWFRNWSGQARAFPMNVLACTAVLNARSSGGLLLCSGSLVWIRTRFGRPGQYGLGGNKAHTLVWRPVVCSGRCC